MLGRVPRSHGIVTAEDDEFVLNIGSSLTKEQLRDLIQLCDRRILQYEQRYGKKRRDVDSNF